MGRVFLLWLLIVLFVIAFLDYAPIFALCLAGLSGCAIGVHVFKMHTRYRAVSTAKSSIMLPCILRCEEVLAILVFFFLFVANRLPLWVWLIPVGTLVLLVCYRRIKLGVFLHHTPLDGPVVLLLFAGAISVAISADVYLSISDFGKLMGQVMCYDVLASRLTSARAVRIALIGFLLCGLLVIAIAWLKMVPPPSKLPFIGRAYILMPEWFTRNIHYNYIGGTLTFLVPLAFWCLYFQYDRLTVWLGMICILIGSSLFMTQSRGAILGSGIAILLTSAWSNRRLFVGMCCTILVGGGVLYMMLGASFSFLVEALGSGRPFLSRLELWDRALHIVQDFPFTGVGLHMFPQVLDMLYPMRTIMPAGHLPHAHNLYLHMAAETGFPGLVALCMVFGVTGTLLWTTLTSLQDGPYKSLQPVVLGLLGGVLAHAIYSVTDTIALGEKAGIMLWATLGIAVALWRLSVDEKVR